MDGGKLTVESYQLHPIDDTIPGDRAISDEIDKFKKTVTEVVFASRGYSIDQPLAVAPRDLPNTYTDIAAGTLLANLCTDAFRSATKADIGIHRNGNDARRPYPWEVRRANCLRRIRRGAHRRRRGGSTAGSALVTGYFTGQELKNLLEFLLVDNPAHPGETFPARLRHEVPLRPVAPAVRRRNGDRDGRPRSWLPRDRHQREGRAPV